MRTFQEHECSYILPGDDWEWLDPKLLNPTGRYLVFCRNDRGTAFSLGVELVKNDEAPTPNSFVTFETRFIASGGYKKLSGKHISFAGLPSYQFEGEKPGGPGTPGVTERITYANQRLYVLSVINGAGPFDPDVDREKIFGGFRFTKKPEPVFGNDENQGATSGNVIGKAIGTVLIAVVVVVVVLVTLRRKQQ
jgi:hypothetical protein